MLEALTAFLGLSTFILYSILKPFINIYEQTKDFVQNNVWVIQDSIFSDIKWILLENLSSLSFLSVCSVLFLLSIIYFIFNHILNNIYQYGFDEYFGAPLIDGILLVILLSCCYLAVSNEVNHMEWVDLSKGFNIVNISVIICAICLVLSLVNCIICNLSAQTGTATLISAVVIKAFLLTCGPALIALAIIATLVIFAIVMVIGFILSYENTNRELYHKWGRKPTEA